MKKPLDSIALVLQVYFPVVGQYRGSSGRGWQSVTQFYEVLSLSSQGICLCVVKTTELNHVHIPTHTEEGKQFWFSIFFF